MKYHSSLPKDSECSKARHNNSRKVFYDIEMISKYIIQRLQQVKIKQVKLFVVSTKYIVVCQKTTGVGEIADNVYYSLQGEDLIISICKKLQLNNDTLKRQIIFYHLWSILITASYFIICFIILAGVMPAGVVRYSMCLFRVLMTTLIGTSLVHG